MRVTGRNLDIQELPDICICARDSDAWKWLESQYNCFTDVERNPICYPLKGKINAFTHVVAQIPPQDPAPGPNGGKQACSGSCLDPEDCDSSENCLCASNKGVFFSTDNFIMMDLYESHQERFRPIAIS